VIDCVKDLETAARAVEEQAARMERWARDTPAVAAQVRRHEKAELADEMQACADEFAAGAAAARATLDQLGAAIEHARAGHERWKGYLRGAAQGVGAQARAAESEDPAPRLAAGGAR
jgi:hypothetical protein